MKKRCTKCGEKKAVGEFYPRKIAKDGHESKCKVCIKESCRKYREENKEKNREYFRQWRKANSEKVRKRNREQYEKDPEAARKRGRDYYAANRKERLAQQHERRKTDRFAVALVDSRGQAKKGDYAPCNATVEELKAAFSGRCAICAVPELELNKKLHMDHDHTTGEFRGWLCYLCNNMLGLARDSEDILINALHYLMSNSRQQQE